MQCQSACIAWAALLLVACEASSPAVARASPSNLEAFRAPAWQAPICNPVSASSPLARGQEIQGNAKPPNAQFWALAPLPVKAPGDKFVFRITGTGSFHLYADGPEGLQIVSPKLMRHTSSSWDRPGDEWGGNLWTPEPGCWEVHALRNDTQGSMSFNVIR
jgi:hypothetical protein